MEGLFFGLLGTRGDGGQGHRKRALWQNGAVKTFGPGGILGAAVHQWLAEAMMAVVGEKQQHEGTAKHSQGWAHSLCVVPLVRVSKVNLRFML